MDTKIPVIFMLALAVGASMWIGSGIAGELASDPTDGMSSHERLEEQANDSAVNNDDDQEGFVGEVDPQDDESSIVGLIISGGHGVVDVFAFVLLLPFELRNLGFPGWFAFPLGSSVQLLAGVGLIQFVTNRVFR